MFASSCDALKQVNLHKAEVRHLYLDLDYLEDFYNYICISSNMGNFVYLMTEIMDIKCFMHYNVFFINLSWAVQVTNDTLLTY